MGRWTLDRKSRDREDHWWITLVSDLTMSEPLSELKALRYGGLRETLPSLCLYLEPSDTAGKHAVWLLGITRL